MDNAPILIVDDDTDDREFLQDAWKELGLANALIFFKSGKDVLGYLQTEQNAPFLILCDVNLPSMNGFELKEKIQADTELNYKSIPFVFWSNVASKTQIQKAYDLGGNGFFIKGDKFEDIKQSLVDIVQYWRRSKTPSQNSD